MEVDSPGHSSPVLPFLNALGSPSLVQFHWLRAGLGVLSWRMSWSGRGGQVGYVGGAPDRCGTGLCNLVLPTQFRAERGERRSWDPDSVASWTHRVAQTMAEVGRIGCRKEPPTDGDKMEMLWEG